MSMTGSACTSHCTPLGPYMNRSFGEGRRKNGRLAAFRSWMYIYGYIYMCIYIRNLLCCRSPLSRPPWSSGRPLNYSPQVIAVGATEQPHHLGRHRPGRRAPTRATASLPGKTHNRALCREPVLSLAVLDSVRVESTSLQPKTCNRPLGLVRPPGRKRPKGL